MPQRDEHTPPHTPQQIIEELRRDNERLREDLRRSEAERQRLRRENEKLKDELEAARRAVSRQAAPFSRGTRVAVPKRPGRQAGRRLWAAARIAVRRRTSTRPTTRRCPRTVRTATARCAACGSRGNIRKSCPSSGRSSACFTSRSGAAPSAAGACKDGMPLQTSDALGAAAVQLGPQAVAFAVLLNKRFGLPYGKITALLRDRCGLRVTRGGLVQAIHRAARQAQPTYAALCATVRGSPVVTADETSWRVDADLQWLWAFVTPETTVYAIQPGRGLAQAAHVIGVDYPGVLQRDGWQSYRQFTHAAHQTCLAHLLRRCRVLLLDYPAQPFVTAVKAILQAALATRDRYHAGGLSDHGLAVARGHYLERLGQLLQRTPSRRLAVRRFQQHLIVEFDALFSFLFDPTLDATNWRAEHALRPGRRHPQDVRRRQSHAPRRRQSAGAGQCPPDRRPTRARRDRGARRAAHRIDARRAAQPWGGPRDTLTR